MVTSPFRFTTKDLEEVPDKPGFRYEIIDGELYVTRAVNWRHEWTVDHTLLALMNWNEESDLGVVLTAPGLVFADDDNVIPDLIWLRKERLALIEDEKGHFTEAPELVVEVLSPGVANRVRDREIKLDLYNRRGVPEYWIVNWAQKLVEVYRREVGELRLVATLGEGDTLTSPVLPGFACPVASLFPPARLGR